MTIKTLVPRRLRFSRSWPALMGAFWAFTAVSAQAQVIEVGSEGAVTVYDGPAVVTATGATSIQPAARASRGRRRSNASPPSRPSAPLASAISDAARASDISPSLIAAIAWRESNFKASAVSRAGAVGEMQLRPQTARQLGVDPRVSRQNVAGGAAYVRALLQRYDGDLIKTLAAYNAGPKAVDRYGGEPPFKETKAYVAAVLDRLSDESLNRESLGQTDAQPVRTDQARISTSSGPQSPAGLFVFSQAQR